MRQEIIIKDIYKFEELSSEAQKAAIEKFAEWVNEDPWYEDEIGYWKEQLNNIGFEKADIKFSGFWSQGDGASFTASVDLGKIVNTLTCEKYSRGYHALCILREKGIIDLGISITRNSHHYSHEMTCGVNLNWNCWDKPETFENWLADQVKDLEKDIESLRYDLCKKIYKDLEKEYEYQKSPEAIKEIIECNDYEFNADGSLY